MNIPQTEKSAETPLTQDVIYAVRYWLHGLRRRIGGRSGLIAATVLVVGTGLAFNWSWLVAAGLAPILIVVLPCAAMCALGLCMNKGAGRSCSETKQPEVSSTRRVAPPVRLAAVADPGFDGSRPSDDTTVTNDRPATASGEPQTLKERN